MQWCQFQYWMVFGVHRTHLCLLPCLHSGQQTPFSSYVCVQWFRHPLFACYMSRCLDYSGFPTFILKFAMRFLHFLPQLWKFSMQKRPVAYWCASFCSHPQLFCSRSMHFLYMKLLSHVALDVQEHDEGYKITPCDYLQSFNSGKHSYTVPFLVRMF